ncbi:MAG: carbohydrate kinase family protein [Euzebya sp.]
MSTTSSTVAPSARRTSLVAVVGDILVDLLVSPGMAPQAGSDTESDISWRQGGAAALTAAWLSRLGVPTRFVGRVGDDAGGRFLVQQLESVGLDVRVRVDGAAPTGTVVALLTSGRHPLAAPDRDMFTSRGASGNLAPTDLTSGWLTGIRHLHLSGYTLLHDGSRAAGLAALDQAVTAGISISVDPASTAPLTEVGPQAFLSWLPPGTLLTPNDEEATLLTGMSDPARAAMALAAVAGEAAVTCGADGVVWSDGSRLITESAAAVTIAASALNPLGAGDAFTAGLLAARIQGLPIQLQLRRGVEAAARLVTGGRA